MRQYYIMTADGQRGPLTIDEMKSAGLTPDTMVWYEGLDNWAKAAAVPELDPVLYSQATDDAVATVDTSDTTDECPDPHMGLAIFSAIMFPMGIAAIVKSALVKSRWDAGRHDDARWLAETSHKYAIRSIWIGGILLALFMTYYTALILFILGAALHI